MRSVRCYDCGRIYNYDEDGFCPGCGAFNQPPRDLRIGADGSVVRVDGLNEVNHVNSFVHRELHEEKRERRRIGLDKGVQRIQRTNTGRSVGGSARTAPPMATLLQTRGKDRRQSRQGEKNPLGIVAWVIILIMLFSLLPRLLLAL